MARPRAILARGDVLGMEAQASNMLSDAKVSAALKIDDDQTR